MRITRLCTGAVSAVAVSLAVLFCVYPAVIVGVLLTDSKLKREGQSRLVPVWFKSLAVRYESWADGYLKSGYARTVSEVDVAGTEWPMFGTVYFLVTADELQRQGKIDARAGQVRRAVDRAVAIVVSPDTASWVKAKWGDAYLTRENVFYRMLLILGLSSYERITGDTRHRALMSAQRKGLAEELERARYHVLDDYPGECWPNDVLWSVAAIQRAARLEGQSHDALARGLMNALDGPLKVAGLPAFKVDKLTARVWETPRGCGNSGILSFAAELDAEIASRWYREHVAQFWKQTLWLAGFTELPRGSKETYSDVDSGPVAFEFGSVASAFGIGAAKSVGRMDHAATLTLEAVACSWPTPFGFLLPSAMGKVAMDGGCLAETALLFSMTRPCCVPETVPFAGPAPLLVWLMLAAYAGSGAVFLGVELRAWRRFFAGREKAVVVRGDKEHERGTYLAPWGAALTWVSALTTILVGALTLAPIPGLGWPRLFLLSIPVGALPFVVRRYEIRDGALFIRRLWWNTRIELAGLLSVRCDPGALKGSVKTCGNGGLFSFTGWYWSRQLGSYRMYVTDLKRPVVLMFERRCLVVSPDDPEAFVHELAAGCGGGAKRSPALEATRAPEGASPFH
jgi:hypothetical protein